MCISHGTQFLTIIKYDTFDFFYNYDTSGSSALHEK
jgi:hypothetical protein